MAKTAVREGLDQVWLNGFVEGWAEAWNSHEPSRLLALMTDDIVYDDSAWATTMHGHGEVREFLESAWRAFPDLRFEVTEGPFVDPQAPKSAFFWKGSATHTGPIEPPGFAATGKRVEFEGADFHEYRDGRVCRLRIVFDMMDIARQIGTLPQAGSRMEKAGAAAQRIGTKVRERIAR